MSNETTKEIIDTLQQYLTFQLGDEVFCLDISQVREVLDFTNITKVPRTPDFMRGVINLRGGVVPVVDLRLKFGMAKTEKTRRTCIIIVEVNVDGENTVLGALADSVEEVIEMEPGQIEPAPRIGTRLNTNFIRGMGKHNDQFVIILDIDRVFSSDELSVFQGAGDLPLTEKGLFGEEKNAAAVNISQLPITAPEALAAAP
jgi:purine-binding chemotaxis protein CheW